MPGKAAQLAIRLSETGAEDAARALDHVASSADNMGSKVESAGRSAEKGAAGLDKTAEGADEVASKGAQAAGAMSGLGDLIGGPFGAAMQTGGIALQAAADSGDLLNAALENSVVSSLRAKAATVGKTVADKASAVATRTMTIAQKALNLAQRASPIGLIIAGVLLLVGALILAYKRSATFRAIVDKAMSVAKAGVDKVVGAFKALGPVVGKVMAFIGDVVGKYVGLYVKAFQLVLKGATAAWDSIKKAASDSIGWLIDKAKDIKTDVVGAFDVLKEKGTAAFQALIDPIQHIIDLVDSVLDKIKSIHVPDINPFNRGGSSIVDRPTSSGSSTSTVNLTLNVTASPGTTTSETSQQAQDMMDAIDARLRLVGRKPVFQR